MRKKRRILCLALCAAFFLAAWGFLFYEAVKPEYTYAELEAMPADELTDLFVANGLEIDEEFREIMTKEEFQELFKRNLMPFSQGITTYGHVIYSTLADSAKEVYEKLTSWKF